MLLGVTAVFLGLGSLLIRFWRGEGMGLGAILAIVFGVVAVALSGRLREVGE